LQFNLKRLLPEQIDNQMSYILAQENIDAEPAALKVLARAADGSLRDGLSLLDQAIAFGNGKVGLETVTNMLGTVAQKPVDEILLALANNNAIELLQKIADVSELTPDFADILQQILRALHRVTLTQSIPDFVDNDFDGDIITQLANQLLPEDVQLFYQIGLIGQRDLDLAPDPRSGFEMVMLRMLTFKPDDGSTQVVPPKANVAKVNKLEVKEPVVSTEKVMMQDEVKLQAAQVCNDNNWAEIVIAMKIGGMTRELANNCVLDSLDDKSCNLVLNPGHIQLVSLKSEENLQQALQQYYGKPIKLNIKTEKFDNTTPAQQITKQREDRQQVAVDSINADENVQALKEHFGARVLPGTIEPL
jgi:DNA polymerase-3 subunit gamma/tau